MNTSGKTQVVLITGIGTGVGKTIVSAIVSEALQADYWKPVQAGYEDGTDSEWVQNVITTRVHPECYRLKMAASPHIAARAENKRIEMGEICKNVPECDRLVIEGAGGLMVPLNEEEFVADMALSLDIPVIIVSRNYLGSINHSLLTALACKMKKVKVIGWIFNDHFMDYENEVESWSGFPRLASIPYHDKPDRKFVAEQAFIISNKLQSITW